MTKLILSAAVIATITFSGCSQVTDTVGSVAKGTVDVAKGATEKVTSTVSDTVSSTKDAANDKANKIDASLDSVDNAALSSMKVDAPEASLKVGDVVESKIDDASASAVATLPTSSSMTDMATDKVVEVADAKTDGSASQVIDALK